MGANTKSRLLGLTESAKEQLIQKMLARRGRAGHGAADASSERLDGAGADAPFGDIPDAWCRFDDVPGYVQIKVQQKAAEKFGIESPFLRVHESIDSSTARIGGREFINFSSYNYLDLCGHPDVSAAAKAAVDIYGTSASASRVVAGERPVHRQLERALADLYVVDDCVAFVSGHATNVTSIGHLFGARDFILYDKLIHNSIRQGAVLSGARQMAFAHNDFEALDDLLSKHRRDHQRVLIVLEGIYSMDGDFPDLPRFIELKNRYRCILMVDEAHALGVLGETGKGIHEHFGIDGREVDIWMGTLSKTLASCGGYIAGAAPLVEYLKLTAPGFLYSVGMAPPVAAAAHAALRIMRSEPERSAGLKTRGQQFLALARERKLNTGSSEGFSVVPVICKSSIKTVKLSNALYRRGINVMPIIYPAVEERAARLRFFMSCAHTEEQIRETVDAVAEEAGKSGVTGIF